MTGRVRKQPPQVKADPVLSYFWRRIYRYDQNVLLIVCGQTGSCKSGSAITLANLFDRDENNESRFSIDRVVFKPSDFVDLVNSGDLPKGSAIIWDEIGVEHDSRNYYTNKNKLIKYVMQTFRYKNFVLIMTVPDLKSVDIGTRRLLHCYLEMHGPLGNRKYASGLLRYVQVNPRSGKEYYKMPRFFKNKQKKGMMTYYVARPPKELEVPYKEKKVETTKAWYKDFKSQLAYMEQVVGEEHDRKKAAGIDDMDLAAKVMEEPLLAYDAKRKRFPGGLVQAFLRNAGIEVARTKAYSVAELLNFKLRNGEISVQDSV